METVLWDVFAFAVLPVLSSMAVAALGVALKGLYRWAERQGIEIDKGHRETLNQAIETGKNLAVARAQGRPIDPRDIIEYVRDIGAPGAVRHFGMGSMALERKASGAPPPAKTHVPGVPGAGQ